MEARNSGQQSFEPKTRSCFGSREWCSCYRSHPPSLQHGPILADVGCICLLHLLTHTHNFDFCHLLIIGMNARTIPSLTTAYKRSVVGQAISFSVQKRSFAATAGSMAKFDINSKIKLNSGWEIPRLGYGMFTSHFYITLVFRSSFEDLRLIESRTPTTNEPNSMSYASCD